MRALAFARSSSALLCAFALCGASLAAAEQQDVIRMSAVSQDVRVSIGKTGHAVMDHIEKAQKAMATSSDFQAALSETEAALTLLGSAEHMSPTAVFHNAMAELLHRHRAKKATSDDVLKVEGVLDDVKQVNGVEVADVHDKLVKVKGKLEKDPTVDAEADLLDASDDVSYLEIDLPIQQTRTRLLQAREAELQRDRGNADAELAAAISHVKKWTATAEGTVVEGEARSK